MLKTKAFQVSFADGFFGFRNKRLQAKVCGRSLHFLNKRTETPVVFLEGQRKIALALLEGIRQSGCAVYSQ